MKDMGFQACCLWCDEPDEIGSDRCGKCIESHRRIRDEIAKAQGNDAFYQFAKELLSMSVAPHRYDNDPVHGPWLVEQQRKASEYVPKEKKQTEKDVINVFFNLKPAWSHPIAIFSFIIYSLLKVNYSLITINIFI